MYGHGIMTLANCQVKSRTQATKEGARHAPGTLLAFQTGPGLLSTFQVFGDAGESLQDFHRDGEQDRRVLLGGDLHQS